MAHYKWEDDKKAYYLREFLSIEVSNFLWSCGKAETVEECLTHLRSRYGRDNLAEHYQSRLRALKRDKADTPYDVYQKIKSLSAMAYPGEELNPYVISNNVGKYSELLPELGLRREFARTKPKSLEEALRMAVAFSEPDAAVEQALGGRPPRDSDFDADGRRKEKLHVRGVEAQAAAITAQPPEGGLQKELEELRAKMAALQEQLATPKTSSNYKGKKPHTGPGKRSRDITSGNAPRRDKREREKHLSQLTHLQHLQQLPREQRGVNQTQKRISTWN